MEEEMARGKDTEERMAAVECLHQLLESLVPAVLERLGDSEQPVRDAVRRLLTTLMEVSSPTIRVERAGSSAWMHNTWRVREEFARTVTSALVLFASTVLSLRVTLNPILHLLYDPNEAVKEAAILCIEELYMQGGSQFREELQRHHLPPYMVKDINSRLERMEPLQRSTDSRSPRANAATRENSLFGGDANITENPIEPIKEYTLKQLFELDDKIASTPALSGDADMTENPIEPIKEYMEIPECSESTKPWTNQGEEMSLRYNLIDEWPPLGSRARVYYS